MSTKTKTAAITRAALVKSVAANTSLSQAKVKEALDALTLQVRESLKHGDAVRLDGICTITPVTTKARKGRNPRTGETVDFPARKTAKFKLSQNLKKELQGGN